MGEQALPVQAQSTWVIRDVSEYEVNEDVREKYWETMNEVENVLRGFMKSAIVVALTYEWYVPHQRPAPSPRDDLTITIVRMYRRALPFGVAKYRYKASEYAEDMYLKVVAWFEILSETDIDRVIGFIGKIAGIADVNGGEDAGEECYSTCVSAIDVAHRVSEALTDVYLYNTKGMDLELHDSGGDYPEAEFTMFYYG